MTSNTTKWSRKRSIEDESRSSPPTSEREPSKRDWKVKTLDEILQEKRRRLDHESPEGESETFPQSAKSSVASSPGLRIDSRASSKNQTPNQEIIYQLSPDHSSPLSTSSETSRRKAASLNQKRRKTDEEEGEILSDISDTETGGSRQRSRASSRHVSIDLEMVDKPPVQEESKNQEEEGEESEEESSDDDSDSSSEEEPEETTKNTPQPGTAKSSDEEEDEEEESSDSSKESDDSSEEEEEEEEEEGEEKAQVKDTTSKEKKVEDKEGSSEEDSDEDSDDESESDDSSDDEEEEATTSPKEVQPKTTVTSNEVSSKIPKEESPQITKTTKKEAVEKPTKTKDKEHRSSESLSRHRKQERGRHDEKDSERAQEERSVTARSKRDRKYSKGDDTRSSSRHKSSTESSEHKKSRDSKSREKDRGEGTRSREHSERQNKDNSKAKRKELKPDSKEERSKDFNNSANPPHKSIDSKIKKNEAKHETVTNILSEEERLQFSSEVINSESDDDHNADDSVDDNSDNEEVDIEESNEEEEKQPEEPKLPDYLPAVQGCRIVDEFTWLNRIEEGTYGVVYRARDKRTNEIVALKRLKMEKEKEGFPITSLREINTLLKGQHPNIVTVREVVVGKDMDKIFIVMDYVEHDLKTLMEHMSNKFAIGEVKTLLVQLLRAVTHLHDNWILHRDLKTSNLLLSNKGILKVADFGLAREYGSPLKPYTPIVVTLWYRAPELLLGVKEYACPIDMWSVGCIFAELLTMKPLFPGKSEIDQINRIFKDLGTPSDKIWPGPPSYSELPHVKKMTFTDYPYNQLRNKFGTHLTDKGFDLLNRFLTYDPNKRITAEQALKHEYFNESPYPIKPDMFPTWPAKSEMQKRPKKKDYEHSPKAPEGGEMFSKLKDGGDSSSAAEGLGFHMPSSKKGSAAVAGFSLKFNLK